MRRVLEEFPDAAAAIHEAMAEELTRLTNDLEWVRQQPRVEAFASMDPSTPTARRCGECWTALVQTLQGRAYLRSYHQAAGLSACSGAWERI
jgi:hypothetical protein